MLDGAPLSLSLSLDSRFLSVIRIDLFSALLALPHLPFLSSLLRSSPFVSVCLPNGTSRCVQIPHPAFTRTLKGDPLGSQAPSAQTKLRAEGPASQKRGRPLERSAIWKINTQNMFQLRPHSH